MSSARRTTGSVLVEILVTKDCPHGEAAVDLVGQAANALHLTPKVMVIEVDDLAEAEQHGFVGSPTIRIDGRDVSPPPHVDPSLSCRLYRTAGGRRGVPELSTVLRALQDARGEATGPGLSSRP